jgi:hypothetical protein
MECCGADQYGSCIQCPITERPETACRLQLVPLALIGGPGMIPWAGLGFSSLGWPYHWDGGPI